MIPYELNAFGGTPSLHVTSARSSNSLQGGGTDLGGEPAENQEGPRVTGEAQGDSETLAADFSAGASHHQHEAAPEAGQANGAAGGGEGDAKEKLRQMLEAQKAQDPNFAKLTGTAHTVLPL